MDSPASEAAAAAARADEIRNRDNTQTYTNVSNYLAPPHKSRRNPISENLNGGRRRNRSNARKNSRRQKRKTARRSRRGSRRYAH